MLSCEKKERVSIWNDQLPSAFTVENTISKPFLDTHEEQIRLISPTSTISVVSFIDWNGSVLDTQLVANGFAAEAPIAPSRPGFIFIGWDVDFSRITSNTTVAAMYEIVLCSRCNLSPCECPPPITGPTEPHIPTEPPPEQPDTGIGNKEPPLTVWGALRHLPIDETIPNGIVAYDDEDGGTRFVPFCHEIEGRVWFFGEPDIEYYLKANPKQFSDVSSGQWWTGSIMFTAEREVYQGFAVGSFSPNGLVTRAQFATVLARLAMADLDNHTTRVFVDVDPTAWYGPQIAWAFNSGIVEGVGRNRFDPNGYITRQQMVLMIYRFVKEYDMDLFDIGDPGSFTDEESIAAWAADAVSAMRKYGIVTGIDGAFVPHGNSTRAQVATVLQRLVVSAIEEAVRVSR